MIAQEQGNKIQLDYYSTETVSPCSCLHNTLIVINYAGSSQLMLQKFANVDLEKMSFDYTAEENEFTVWPSKSSEN